MIRRYFRTIKMEAFTDPTEFRQHMDEFLRELKDSPRAVGCDRIYVPGGKEFEADSRTRWQEIPVV